MCRILGYLGKPIQLDRVLVNPEHSLVVQSYQPKEMTAGLLNADGFGVGWYHAERDTDPYTYKNVLPIWNDSNLTSLSRYVESGCILSNVRSATPGQAIDLSNCQPFQWKSLLAIHNGYIENFHQTLYRPIRAQLHDQIYQGIQGRTDSEHILALLFNQQLMMPDISLEAALAKVLYTLVELATNYETGISANLMVSDGQELLACRFACRGDHSTLPAPSLYYIQDDPQFPQASLIASEPLFAGRWMACPEHSIIKISADRTVTIQHL